MLNEPELVRESTINFAMKYFEKNGDLPSIGFLCDKDKGLAGLNRTKFYEAFPQGVRELAEAIGVDVPQKRIASTKRALAGKEKAALKADSMDEIDVNSLMRLLGSKTPKQAGKEAVSFISGMVSYSELKGVKPPEAWEAMQCEIDEYRDKYIQIALELDNWRWSDDAEMAQIIGLNSKTMKRFRRAQLKNPNPGLSDFLNYSVQAYFTLLKHVGLKDEGVQ